MYNIFVINGQGGCGKDTFISMVSQIIGGEKVYNISTVDLVKEYARKFGWKGTKTNEDRKALSDLKDIMTLWEDIPFKDVVYKVQAKIDIWKIKNNEEGFIFIHCREPEEITRLCKELNAKSLLIIRENKELFFNHADDNVYNYKYDYEIDNNGSLNELAQKAILFIRKIRAKE